MARAAPMKLIIGIPVVCHIGRLPLAMTPPLTAKCGLLKRDQYIAAAFPGGE